MQDSVRDAFMVALKELGYSMNTTDVGELEEAKKLLLAQKPLVQAYVVDQVRDKMLNGEAAVGVIYSGELLYLQEEAEHWISIMILSTFFLKGNKPVDRFLGHPGQREE